MLGGRPLSTAAASRELIDTPRIRRNAPILLQHQIAQAADAQERREVSHLAAPLEQLVVELADELIDRQAVALADFFKHFPEQALQPHAGRYAVQA